MLKIKKSILIFICLFLSILIFIRFKILPNYRSLEYDWPMGKNGVRYILYWDKMWYYDDFGFGFGNKIFENCPVKNCFTTKNKYLIPTEEFDALIFHGAEYFESIFTNPAKRDPKQVYIYYNLESPFITPSYLKYSYRFFNWTMTYR